MGAIISMGGKSHHQRLGSNQTPRSISLGLHMAAPSWGRGIRRKQRTAWCGQFIAALSGTTRRIFDQKKKILLLLGIKMKFPILAMRSFPTPYRPDKRDLGSRAVMRESWHGLANIRMFYWPIRGLHKQRAFLLDGDRSRQLGESRANGVMAELVCYLSSFTQSIQDKRARNWHRVPHCVALGQPLPFSELQELPVKPKVNPRHKVDTTLLPSHLPASLGLFSFPRGSWAQRLRSQGAPSS